MTEAEQLYDQRFNACNRKPDAIYFDAMSLFYGVDEQDITEKWNKFVIVPPSVEFTEQLTILINNKQYGKIFGEYLGETQSVFDPYGFIHLELDQLHVFVFPPTDWLRIASDDKYVMAEYIRQLRIELGPQFPEKIKGHTMAIVNMNDPNNKRVELTTYDYIEGQHLEKLFQLYNDWFVKHAQTISSQFKAIADEVRDWLVSKYQISPTSDGFVSWFIAVKLNGGLTLRSYQRNNGTYDIELEFGMLRNTLTPAVIEEHIHEYSSWRKQRHEKAELKVSSATSQFPPDTPAPLIIDRPLQSSFESYIVEQHRAELTPFLKMHYTDQKPEQYGFMLYALVNSGCMTATALTANQTALHRSLEDTFGNVGTRQNLNTAISRLNSNASTIEDKRHIEEHTKRITMHLRKASNI